MVIDDAGRSVAIGSTQSKDGNDETNHQEKYDSHESITADSKSTTVDELRREKVC